MRLFEGLYLLGQANPVHGLESESIHRPQVPLEFSLAVARRNGFMRINFDAPISKPRLALMGYFSWPRVCFRGSAQAQGVTAGSIKGTVAPPRRSFRPRGTAERRAPSLDNKDLKAEPLKTVTDGTGSFAFLDLPAANYTLIAEADGLPSVTHEVRLNTGGALVVDVILTATVSESVTVHEEEGLLSTAETTTSNTVRARKLE